MHYGATLIDIHTIKGTDFLIPSQIMVFPNRLIEAERNLATDAGPPGYQKEVRETASGLFLHSLGQSERS